MISQKKALKEKQVEAPPVFSLEKSRNRPK
jgi:hypothetical protein